MTQKELAAALGMSVQGLRLNLAKGMPSDSVEKARKWREKHVQTKQAVASFGETRLERAKLDIEARKLDLDERRRDLIDRKEAERLIFERARFERDSWLGWASATAPILAAQFGADPGAFFAAMEAHVRLQLQALADTPFEGL